MSAEPGTTRDFVEARVVWNGVGVTLIDTAGLRETSSELERRGIDLGAARARRADVEVHLVASDQLGVMDDVEGARVVRAVSKGDMLAPGAAAPCLVTSAVTGQGVEDLIAAVLSVAMSGSAEQDGGALLTSERQRALVVRAESGFARAAAAVERPEEVLALEVREAVDALAEILGERVGDEMLDALFARFCIGK